MSEPNKPLEDILAQIVPAWREGESVVMYSERRTELLDSLRDLFARRHTDEQVAACIEALKILDPKTVRKMLKELVDRSTPCPGGQLHRGHTQRIADQLLKEFVSE